MIYWPQKSIFNRPSGGESFLEKLVVNTKFSRPIGKDLSLAAKSNTSHVASIAVLLFFRRPSAVVRAIVSVSIYAIQCCALRAFAHVRKKQCKRIPAFADCNSTCAVVSPHRGIGICAPFVHGSPTVVCRRWLPPGSSANTFVLSHLSLLTRFLVRAVAGSQVLRRFRSFSIHAGDCLQPDAVGD